MSADMDQRFAPPQAHVQDLAPPGEHVLASRGERLLAAVVDVLLVSGATWALSSIPALRSLIVDARLGTGFLAWRPHSMVLDLLVFLLIQSWPLLTRGQTVGKMLFRLRIVRTDGSRVQAWRLLGPRYGIGFVMDGNPMLTLIYGLLDSLLIFRKSRQCLHDTIADTKVIKL